jgi:hypothetical protein
MGLNPEVDEILVGCLGGGFFVAGSWVCGRET